MNYVFTNLPNQGQMKKYRVRDFQKKNETFFNFTYGLIGTWGNPEDARLRNIMIAYIKSKGWAKAPVEFNTSNAPKHLNELLHSLQKK